jgi:hypothetical protein
MEEECDVAVIGGGSAGLCAAVAAARDGARVVLVEGLSQLGGMGTRAKVHTFCGLYHPDVSQGPRLVNPGLPGELEGLMRARTGVDPVLMGRMYVLPQDPRVYAQVASDLVAAEAPRLSLRLEAHCHRIERVDVGYKVSAGDEKWVAKALVDTTASARVADLLNVERVVSDPANRQRPAFIFSLTGVGAEAGEESFRMRLALEIVRAVEAGTLPKALLAAASRAGTREGEFFFTLDLDPAEMVPNPEEADYEKLRSEGEILAKELVAFLRSRMEPFGQCSEPESAQSLGVRECYRWPGRYLLTGNDLIAGKVFSDVVAWASWPLELREDTRGPRFEFFEKAEPSGIPLRSLSSESFSGVYFAGRCLSADHRALASVRVMGTCFATGQAAGLAAAAHAEGIIAPELIAARVQKALGLEAFGVKSVGG